LQKVVLDESLRARLQNLNELIELRDESGKVVGHFLPLNQPTGLIDALRLCPHSDEELERFGQEPGGRTLAEMRNWSGPAVGRSFPTGFERRDWRRHPPCVALEC
jgi:hypothetical protein